MMSVCTTAALSEAFVASGFCAGALPIEIQQPRTIISLGATDYLALERATNSVVLGEDLNGDGIPESIRTLVSLPGLTHGLALSSTHLYASKSTEVYRWPFNATTKAIALDAQETVIQNMNANGQGGAPFGHTTRSLAVKEGSSNGTTGLELYVSVGSNENVDPDSFRARIRRFPLDDPTKFPIDFLTGEVFADGIRNEVGIEFHPDGTLWGVGNSADQLFRLDLGGDIHNDNPAEELHRFGEPGLNYGYPYCWREFNMVLGKGRGTAWAWPSFKDTVSDEDCRRNYDTPLTVMQGHSAPLGITFYQYKETRPPQCAGVKPFPPEMNGFAFVAFHGSWNRPVPTGYKVVYIPTTPDGKSVVGGMSAVPQDLLRHEGLNDNWSDGFRPVDVSFDACGRLLVTSDGSRSLQGDFQGDKIVRIESLQANLPPPPAPNPPSLGNGLILAFFLGVWTRIRKFLGLLD